MLPLFISCKSCPLVNYLYAVINYLKCYSVTILVLISPLQKSTVIFTIAVDTNCLTKLDKSFRCQAEAFQAGEGESSHLPC